MKKILATGISAIALLVSTAPAYATVTDLGSFALSDSNSGPNFFSFFSYFNEAAAAGDYVIKYTFGFTGDGSGAGDISASLVGGDNTSFNSVNLNGSAFDLTSGNTLGHLTSGPVFSGSNVLTVNFKVLTNGVGAFNGSVSAAPVPEPATWAMMLVGFGLIGFGLRRRREKVTTRVRFAMS